MPARFTVLHAALALASVVAASPSAAQSPESSPSSPQRFSTELVVTPERGEVPRGLVPAVTVVLTEADLHARPVTHPGEISGVLPGFFAARPEFHAGTPVLSARGFFGGGEAEYVLLLVDGVPAADVESGLIDWSAVSLGSIQRVEASRGPGASLYGDSAIGGVVQIFTSRPATVGQASISGGSFGTYIGDVSYGRRAGALGYTVSGAVRRTGGAFDHAAAREAVVGASADGTGQRVSWRWNIAANDRMRENPGAATRAAFEADRHASDEIHRFDRGDRSGASAAFVLRHDSSLRPQARVHLGWRQDDVVRTILLAPGFGDRRARELSGLTVGATLEGERSVPAARSLLLRFGADVARERLETIYRDVSDAGIVGDMSGSSSGRRLRTGLFLSSLADVTDRVRLSAGIRFDNVGDEGFTDGAGDQRAWSPRAGVVVRVHDAQDVSFFAQVSRAFKAPTLDQLFDPRPYPDFQGGTFTISNPSLVPQRAFNVEAGVSGGGRVRWNALAYRMAVDDEIDFDVQTFSYANIGESVHTGLEVDVEGLWWPRVRPSASYALARVTARGSDIQLKNVPRHVFRIGTAADLPGMVTATVRFSHVSGAFLDDEAQVPLDEQSTIDLRLRRAIGRHALFVDALNLFDDRAEQYGFVLAGFDGQAVPYVYGAASRALRAGVTLTF